MRYMEKMFWDSMRMYFAPLTGAFAAVHMEMRRFEKEYDMKRK
jgi:hypothetical protein